MTWISVCLYTVSIRRRRLGYSFNLMADSLQEKIVQLERLSTLQQRFVSDVSHELRHSAVDGAFGY